MQAWTSPGPTLVPSQSKLPLPVYPLTTPPTPRSSCSHPVFVSYSPPRKHRLFQVLAIASKKSSTLATNPALQVSSLLRGARRHGTGATPAASPSLQIGFGRVLGGIRSGCGGVGARLRRGARADAD